MARTAMYVNDFDTSGLGLIVERVEGWLDAPTTQDRVTQLPGRVGAVILAPEAETAPRTITITGVIRRTSNTLVRRATEELQERLSRGTVEIRFVDDVEKMVLARCQAFQVPSGPAQFFNPYNRVSITLFCPDPLVYSLPGTVVAFTSKQRLLLGNAVSAPTIRIYGAVTNPVLTYRDSRGVVKQTMSFTATLGAFDYLEIDSELATVTLYTNGVASNGITLWSAGDFIVGDPQDGDPANGVWPSLEVSGGSGEALYRRAWI